jgi:hypothetical protein
MVMTSCTARPCIHRFSVCHSSRQVAIAYQSFKATTVSGHGRVRVMHHLVALQAVKVKQLDRYHFVAGFRACGPHRGSRTAAHFMLQLVTRCICGVPVFCSSTTLRQRHLENIALPSFGTALR